MKKNCSTCKHRNEIAYSHRIACEYFSKNLHKLNESPLKNGNVPEYAKENGWFNFPSDFDPLWVDSNCSGHSEKSEVIDFDFV